MAIEASDGLIRVFQNVLPASVLRTVIDEAHALANSPNYWIPQVNDTTKYAAINRRTPIKPLQLVMKSS